MSADDEGETRATVGSTLPDAPGGSSDTPRLATFDRPAERFELGEELGRGGMGRVVAATDVSLARSVAIKQVLSDRSDDLVRFEREVRITAELEHPSIVPIHEAGRDAEGRPYYVMRRIEGDPLTARLSGDLRSRLALLPNLLAVVDAAAFAHARHIIHRDIKPSNILLGAYGETHLIDWGLARRLDDVDVGGQAATQLDQLTQAGHIYGTVGYMAPEQARGEAVDMRADVYALGATLFHVLAGHPPFAHLSQAERLAAAVTGDDQVPLDKLEADLPPELVAIVDKAMQRDRAARYAHAGELAADLRAFLGGQLVGAHRYTTGQRLRRFVRRHRFAVALTAASLVTVAVISGLALSRIIEGRAVAVRAEENALARADSLLIERAGSLATTDPTRAAALLLTLRADTPHQERARDAVAKISAFGIARGAAVHTRQVNGIAVSPDGATIASVSIDGLVVVYDVATARRSTLVNLRAILNAVEWVDDRTLLVASSQLGGARLVDVQTGTARAFGDPAITSWWRAGDRIRYLHQTTIYELPLAGGRARELARDVSEAVGQGEVALYATPDGVFALDGYEARRLREPLAVLAMTISPDGKRAAASTRTETIEWEIATARQTQRWSVGTLLWLDYAPQGLVTLAAGELDVLYPDGRFMRRPYKTAPLWRTRVEHGLVMTNDVGELTVLDGAGFHTVDQHHVGTRVIAARADRGVLALGSLDGSVRWIDLSTVTPRPLPLKSTFGVCTVTNNILFALGAAGVTTIDLRNHTQRTLTSTGPDLNLGVACTPMFGNRIIAYSPLGITIVDLARDSLQSVPGASFPAIDADRAMYGLNNALFELAPDRTEAQQIYTGADEIEGVAFSDQWILMLQGDRRVVRLERSTGATVELGLTYPSHVFGIQPDGSAWLVQRGVLVMWNGVTIRALAVFARDIQSVVPYEDRFFVKLSDGSVWDTADGTAQQRVPEGIRSIVFADRGVAVSKSSQQITTHYMLSGESVIREFVTVDAGVPFSDGRGIMVRASDWAVVFRDVVPEGFAAAKGWLEAVTNARMGDETSAMSWR